MALRDLSLRSYTRGVLQEKGCNFAALRQMSIYVLQSWEIARFVEVQSLKIGHLVCGIDHFDLVISQLKEGTARSRDVTPIYPMPHKYKKKPFVLLSSYQTISKPEMSLVLMMITIFFSQR